MLRPSERKVRNQQLLVRTSWIRCVWRPNHWVGRCRRSLFQRRVDQANSYSSFEPQRTGALYVYRHHQFHSDRYVQSPDWLFPSIYLHLLTSLGRHLWIRESKIDVVNSFFVGTTSRSRFRIYSDILDQTSPHLGMVIPHPSIMPDSMCGMSIQNSISLPEHLANHYFPP